MHAIKGIEERPAWSNADHNIHIVENYMEHHNLENKSKNAFGTQT